MSLSLVRPLTAEPAGFTCLGAHHLMDIPSPNLHSAADTLLKRGTTKRVPRLDRVEGKVMPGVERPVLVQLRYGPGV